MSILLIETMNKMGANVQEIKDENSKEFDRRMLLNCAEIYLEAKKKVPATDGQIKLCDDLVDCGASFDLKETHKDSIFNADMFIKSNYNLLKNPTEDSVRMKEKNASKRIGLPRNPCKEFLETADPEHYNIPNH